MADRTETERPWYLGSGPEARAERIRRGLETPDGDVLALTTWEIEREERLAEVYAARAAREW